MLETYQITSRYFCAGAVVENDWVVCAAPIIKYMVGWSKNRMFSYSAEKGWSCSIV